MSSHTNHPDSHTHGLADDCPRCEEHAKEPWRTLDYQNLYSLIARVAEDWPARSDTEQLAMNNIKEALDAVGIMMRAAPTSVGYFLKDRWRVVINT